MTHPDYSVVSSKWLIQQLFYIQRGSRLNVEYFLLTLFNAIFNVLLPVMEKKFRDLNGLNPQIEREDVLSYLASRLMHITYPA